WTMAAICTIAKRQTKFTNTHVFTDTEVPEAGATTVSPLLFVAVPYFGGLILANTAPTPISGTKRLYRRMVNVAEPASFLAIDRAPDLSSTLNVTLVMVTVTLCIIAAVAITALGVIR